MRKIWQLGAIALILGIVTGCNLTSAPPPRVSPKPGLEKPRQKPAPTAQNPVASATNNPNLLLGNPSNAAPNAASTDNYLMVKPQFVMSYNNKTHTANWVSWQLNRSWIGTADRKNDFRPDDALPANWYKVRPTDYTGSGYDRGHIAPSAVAKRGVSHRTRNESDNSSTFLMSNMMPQSPELNRGVWGDLEEYCRSLVQQGKELYIIAGPVGRKGSIGKKEKIAVPAKTWKVIVVVDRPGLGVSGITSNTLSDRCFYAQRCYSQGQGVEKFQGICTPS